MHGYQLGLFITLFHLLLITLASSAVLGGTMVMHNGKPFFPIGIYHYPKRLPLEPRLEELSRAGFNTVLSGLSPVARPAFGGHGGGWAGSGLPWARSALVFWSA